MGNECFEFKNDGMCADFSKRRVIGNTQHGCKQDKHTVPALADALDDT
jgi:hypothetical protein